MILDNHWQKLKAAQPKLVNDLPRDITLTDDDVNTIATALNKSRWLRINIRSLYKLYKWLPRLAAGYYDDYKEPPASGVWGVHNEYTTEQLNSIFTSVEEDD